MRGRKRYKKALQDIVPFTDALQPQGDRILSCSRERGQAVQGLRSYVERPGIHAHAGSSSGGRSAWMLARWPCESRSTIQSTPWGQEILCARSQGHREHDANQVISRWSVL